MEAGSSPRSVSSKRRVTYRASAWSVHEFEVWSGELLCRASVLRMPGAVLVWAGGRTPRLGDVALAVPHAAGALATPLLGEGATALARRLASALARPAHVCCDLRLDRFTAPLVERGIAAELKAHPHRFTA